MKTARHRYMSGGFAFSALFSTLALRCAQNRGVVIELLQIFIDNIVPILLIASIAFVVGRRQRIDPRPLGKVIFHLFSPALIFDSLSRNRVPLTELAQIAFMLVLFVASMLVIAYTLARWRRFDRVQRAGLMLSAICPNNGNFGIPLIGFAFSEAVLARAVVCYVIITFLNYTAGVAVASSGRKSPRDALLNIARVPAVYGAVAGLLLNVTGTTLPLVLSRPLTLVAQASVPAMLVLLGLQLAQSMTISEIRLVSIGVGLRLLASPVIATLLVMLLGIEGSASIAAVMQASMPVAVVTTLLASEFGLDDRLVSGTIIATTFLCPLTLSPLILILRQSPLFAGA